MLGYVVMRWEGGVGELHLLARPYSGRPTWCLLDD